MNIAVVGSGISGLSAAWKLSLSGHEISLFESNNYFGGHSNTFGVNIDGKEFGVDTGFLVFNNTNYPNFNNFLKKLKVQTVSSSMSFSVKIKKLSSLDDDDLEWSGSSIKTLFAQKKNLINPQFIKMVKDVLKFNFLCNQFIENDSQFQQLTLEEFLFKNKLSKEFVDWYLLPMAGSIWSCSKNKILKFPIKTFLRFFYNHGLNKIFNRPKWQTIRGGSKNYVNKILPFISKKYLNTPIKHINRILMNSNKLVQITTLDDIKFFDHVILATHSDQSLNLIDDINENEKKILSAIKFQNNKAILHTDENCLPKIKKLWSAWNYQGLEGDNENISVNYLINILQPIPTKKSVIVSLNPNFKLDQEKIISTFNYSHPIFDYAAIEAQKSLSTIQGNHNTWFVGAWTGYGFHEDGIKSGFNVADKINNLKN